MGKTAKTPKHGASHREKTGRKHLTDREVSMLIDGATSASRNKERDRCLLLLAYRHGYRVSEICALPLDHVDTESRQLHVRRLKRGLSTTHPLRADEIRAINAWLKIRGKMQVPALGNYLKPGHTLSPQTRPTEVIQNKSSYSSLRSVLQTFL